MCPWIRVEPPLSPELFNQCAVDDTELQAELLEHFVTPLDLQRSWAHDEYSVRALTKHQLQNDQARLDRLAETDIVSNEEIDARHLDRTHDRIKLVAFGLNPASKWRLELPRVGD